MRLFVVGWRTLIANMPFVSEFNYKFTSISIKILAKFPTELEKLTLKFIKTCQEVTFFNFEEKNKVKAHSLPDTKINFKTVAINK